jgi:hypothetical protein
MSKKLFDKINLFFKLASMSPERAAQILEVSLHASLEEIKRAYKKKSFQFHPDRSDLGGSQNIVDINEAWEVLKKFHEDVVVDKTKVDKTEDDFFESLKEAPADSKFNKWSGDRVATSSLSKKLQKALKENIKYKKRTVRLIKSNVVNPQNQSIYDYKRGYVAIINLDTGHCETRFGNWGGGGGGGLGFSSIVDNNDKIFEVPTNKAFVLGSEGGTEQSECTVVIHPGFLLD